MERYAEELKCYKESAETLENLMTIRAFKCSHELGKAKALLRRNCVYTESVTNRCYRTGMFYPLYSPGYRMQLWFYTSSDQIGVTVGILGGHDDYRFIWPLKTIVTVELIDLTGRLEPISQSKRGI